MAVLSRPGLPALVCSLIDLSEGGCRCRADLRAAGEEAAEAWKSALKTSEKVEVQITIAPYLNHLGLPGEIRHLRDYQTDLLEFGMKFSEVASTQEQLGQALQALAKGRAPGEQPPARPPTAVLSKPVTRTRVSHISHVIPRAERLDLHNKKIGEILVSLGVLTPTQLAEALAMSSSRRERLGRCLWKQGWVTPMEICEALSVQSGLPMIDLGEVEIPPEFLKIFSYLTMRRHEFVPFDKSGSTIYVASAQPLKTAALAELEKKCGTTLMVFLAPEQAILERISKLATQRLKERRHARFKVALEATYSFCSADGTALTKQVLPGMVLDLSEGGLKLRGPDASIGGPDQLIQQSVCARVNIICAPESIHAFCGLRFMQPVLGSDPPRWVFGFEILKISEEHRELLRQMCIRGGLARIRGKMGFET
jgi:hypothetical protein